MHLIYIESSRVIMSSNFQGLARICDGISDSLESLSYAECPAPNAIRACNNPLGKLP